MGTLAEWLKHLNMFLPFDPGVLSLGHHLKERIVQTHKNLPTEISRAAFSTGGDDADDPPLGVWGTHGGRGASRTLRRHQKRRCEGQ